MNTPEASRTTITSPPKGARRGRPRLVLILIALIFFAPIAVAYFLNVFHPGWLPFGSTNHGALFSPVQPLAGDDLVAIPSGATAVDLSEVWVLAFVGQAPCQASCEARLAGLRQVHLALGRRADKLQRAWFVLPQGREAIRVQAVEAKFPNLHLLELTSSAQSRLQTAGLTGSDILLVDPAGNAVLHYRADQPPRDVLKDLERLLRISKLKTRSES